MNHSAAYKVESLNAPKPTTWLHRPLDWSNTRDAAMLYGYSKRTINEYGLLELREVTIAASPDVLRQIAGYLVEVANMMEVKEPTPNFHRHIGNHVPSWDGSFPGWDVIATGPLTEEEQKL